MTKNLTDTNQRMLFFFKKRHIFSFQKDGPNEFLYGLDYLQKYYPCQALFAGQYHNLLFKLMAEIIALKTRLGIYLQAYPNNKNKINKKALIFGVQDGSGLGLLFFKLLGKLNNKIFLIVQGLHDRYRYFQGNKLLILFYKKLLSKATLILVFSKYERRLLIKRFQLKPKKVNVFYFGVDLNYWDKNRVADKEKSGEFVLTVGNDLYRDYQLLLNSYNLALPLKIITKSLKAKHFKNLPKATFQHYQEISNETLRKLYHQAKFVIVPLKNTEATSGLSVVLQAFAMGKAVLLAKTPAMQEFFKDYKHVLYYQIGKPASLREKLRELSNNQKLQDKLAKNGRKIVEEKFNSQNMGRNLLRIIKNYLGPTLHY